MFTFNKNTKFIMENASVPVRNAISLLERDRDKLFANTSKAGGSVMLVQKNMAGSIPEPEETHKQRQKKNYLAKERFKISISEDKIVLFAQGDLGFIYGLLYLSEHYLGIHPFWFFMDQKIEQKKKISIPEGVISSKDPVVLFRGWHFEDQTLLAQWDYNRNGTDGWNMVAEALLRCGGNVLVTDTEEISEAVKQTVEQFGLYQTGRKENPGFVADAYDDVFCYNLQPSNHVTMLPCSIDMVNSAWNNALKDGRDCFWAIQCSNIRPHIYFLDAARKKWQGEELTNMSHAEAFAGAYFTECEEKEEIEALFMEYADVMMCLEDSKEYVGELYYTENVRLFCHQLLVDKTNPVKDLFKIAAMGSLTAQIQEFGETCRQQKEELEKLCVACTVAENGSHKKALLSATIGLHIKLHQTCRRAARVFARGYESLLEGDYERAFLRFGDSAVWFDKGDALLRGAEYGVWKNFYANDCITDIKHTAYMVRKVMGLVRELGDNSKHDDWYRRYCLSAEEQMLNRTYIAENHKTDFELYEAMKKRVVR